MEIQDALKEKGKALADAYPDCYAKLDAHGRLFWYCKETDEKRNPVCLAGILGDYWTPY